MLRKVGNLPEMGNNTPYVILAAERFERSRLRITWTDEPRATTDEIERLIAEQWQRRLAQAQLTGQMLFNGELARYVSHEVADGKLRITVGPTCYRDFLGTNLYNSHRVDELGWHRFGNPLGTTGLLITADDQIVLGRRSHRVAFHGGYLHTVGGALEMQDIDDPADVDAFAALLRELSEEVGLTAGEITSTRCMGLIRDTDIFQPELLFEVCLSLTASELCARLDHDDANQEHVGLECCPNRPYAIVDFLHAARPVAPVAVATTMIHGMLTWGDQWYAEQTARL
ncbi:MAG: NUDIX domain-containing protein [Phycisphaerales bacterium]|nr:MAG: NUDIX domain-containing protein [Phycisphaerales bacterium]